MEANNLKKRLDATVVFLCALAITWIYTLDLKNDYYFHFTKKRSTANIDQIKKVEEYKPYLVTISYFNEHTNKQESCTLKLDGHTGSELSESQTLDILYTEQNSCDVYIEGYKHPTKGGFAIHLVIFAISVSGCMIFAKKILRG